MTSDEEAAEMYSRVAQAFEGIGTRDACYIVGRLASVFLAFEDDDKFEKWLTVLRKERQTYIEKGIREGKRPPTEH